MTTAQRNALNVISRHPSTSVITGAGTQEDRHGAWINHRTALALKASGLVTIDHYSAFVVLTQAGLTAIGRPVAA